MRRAKTIGYACALFATVIWSGNFIIARGLGDIIPPVTLSALRWSVGTLALLPFAVRALWRERMLLRKHFGHLAMSALIGVTIFNSLIYVAGHTTNALNMSLIATTTPVFVVILARLFLGEPITLNRLVGLLAAVTGIVILVSRGNLSVLGALDFHIGDIWMLGAAFLWAAYSIHLRKRPMEISQHAYLGSTFLMGVIPLIPAALIEQAFVPEWHLTPAAMGSVLYIGIGASLVAYALWTKAIATVGPATAVYIYYSLPAFCAIEAYSILGEAITSAHGLGFVFILTGIITATHPRFNKSA